MFDEIRRKDGAQPLAVVREVPHKDQSGWQAYTLSGGEKTWAPIRINVSTEDMNNPAKYCTRVGDVRPDFMGGTLVCESENILTDEKRKLLVEQTIPAAVKLHTDRLSVKPVTTSVVVEPLKGSVCSHFTVPKGHGTSGVSGADMIMYAAAGPINGGAAWALLCALLGSKRPFVGVVNIDPRSAVATDVGVRMVAHEIAHALGFGYPEMHGLGMVATVKDVRGKSSVLVVSSPKTKEMAQRHYNCSTIEGMELEDEGNYGTSGSHWERRNARDELMSGVSGASYYTALTMAAFEDMMFYKARWGMEEHMRWGHNSGCKLLEEKCLVNGVTAYPDMFCDEPTFIYQPVCTFDRMFLGFCGMYRHGPRLPPQYRYFMDPSKGGDLDLMDLCPHVVNFDHMGCTNGNPLEMPGSYIGPNSRCVKGRVLRYYHIPIGDVCVDTQCNNGTVSVKFVKEEEWRVCPAGSLLRPKNSIMTGGIECPKYEEVCPFVPSSRGAAPDVGPSETLRNGDQAMSGELSSSTGHKSSERREARPALGGDKEVKSDTSDFNSASEMASAQSSRGNYIVQAKSKGDSSSVDAHEDTGITGSAVPKSSPLHSPESVVTGTRTVEQGTNAFRDKKGLGGFSSTADVQSQVDASLLKGDGSVAAAAGLGPLVLLAVAAAVAAPV
ncbi:surface protease GP63 [Trypanosoma grayi]|uniref:surface protease GP63 n=1 Tax=Trypanosoma grayi TaxID=71804 RepID=UPI0004F42443|nr:surface protease GP63 [Trypanosoma grayi]KEG09800.1 surface protease GP63 [Trypanosoma grayi]